MKRSAPVVPSTRPLGLALAFIAALAAFIALPRIQAIPILAWSFAGAAGVLFAWLGWLWLDAKRQRRRLQLEISLRPQHYLQAIAHTLIFVYWGMYWEPIRDAAPLIAAQIVFAYAFDMLLSWTRKDSWVLGFGPFPIIYSTNLFLRFRDDWFYLQFLMVAVGFLAKELIRWQRDGRQVHIFNPSSFTLALFSFGLIFTGATNITWGVDIASKLFIPPYIYLFIFLVSLPGQFMFGVSSMTLPAVLTTYLFSMGYLWATGTYFFLDSNVPIAVFLGMHLLFTDPSTSPRTDLGRIIFGVIYGLTVIALFAILEYAGVPSFYDKLLQVPFMNLMVRALDRWTTTGALAIWNPANLVPWATARARGFAYASLWVVAFTAMSLANGVGDSHPGHTIPFWEAACKDNRIRGCEALAVIETSYCAQGSGWACNELAILGATGRTKTPPPMDLWIGACAYGVRAACENQKGVNELTGKYLQTDPSLADYALLLQEGKGPLPDETPIARSSRACDQGWMAGCSRLALAYIQEQKTPDFIRARELWERACAGANAASCSNLGLMYNNGDGVPKDREKALGYLKRACELGLPAACRWLSDEAGQK
jgi:hypothetical protein